MEVIVWKGNYDMQYRVFDWLRFPLIVGVVFIHCFGRPFDYASIDYSHLSSMDLYNLFRVSLSHVITHVSVPTFFFISGYLFFKGLEVWDFNAYGRKLKRRVNSLLVPYILWNTISILILCFGLFRGEGINGVHTFFAGNGYWHLYWDSKDISVGQTNWLGGGILSTSPHLVPLWYLRDLIVVIMCSPLLYYFLRKMRIWGLCLLAISYVSGLSINVSGFSATAFLFFGAGAYCKMNNIDPTMIAYKYRKTIAILTLILIMILTVLNGCYTKMGNFIYPWYIILGCINVINIATFIVKSGKFKMPVLLSSGAFFVYLLHKIGIINVLTRLSELLFGLSNPFCMTVSYLLVPIFTVLICIAIYYILNKFSPKLCSALLGGR